MVRIKLTQVDFLLLLLFCSSCYIGVIQDHMFGSHHSHSYNAFAAAILFLFRDQ